MQYGSMFHRQPTFKRKDHYVLVAVRYDDGRSAYIRVSPEVTDIGDLVAIAREHQHRRDIPPGTITAVKRVR